MYRCIFLTVFSSIKFLARFFLPSSEFWLLGLLFTLRLPLLMTTEPW
jgi:hypothetical protein